MGVLHLLETEQLFELFLNDLLPLFHKVSLHLWACTFGPLNHARIDGCRQGWIIASIVNQQLQLSFSPTLLDSQALAAKSTIIIDMPVALPRTIAEYPRTCDKTAKKRVGPATCQYFYAPVIDWLNLPTSPSITPAQSPMPQSYRNKASTCFLKLKSSKPSNRLPQHHIIESHPELIFNHYLPQPLTSKKSADGQQKLGGNSRELANQQHIELHTDDIHEFYNQMKRVCQLDDIYDAIILALLGHDLVTKQTYPLMLSSNR